MEYKVLGSVWFGTIGIVAVRSFNDDWKCYIGIGTGYSKALDQQEIAQLGKPVGKDIATAVFKELDPKCFKG